MQTYQAWFNPNSKSHKALIVADGVAYVGSPTQSDVEVITMVIAAGESPLPLLGTKSSRLTREDIREVIAESSGLDLTIHYDRGDERRFTVVTFTDAASLTAALSHLEQELQLARHIRQHSSFSAAMQPAVWLCILGLFTFVCVGASSQLLSGDEAEIRGRRSGLKRLLVAVLGRIGPNGVYVVGAVLAVPLVWWMVNRIKTPPVITTLKPSNTHSGGN